MQFLLLIFKNVGRNVLRSVLTALGTMVLVWVVTMVWSVLQFFDNATAEKSKDFKAIVTEKWSIPSRMPFKYARELSEGAAEKPGDVKPVDSMTWQFYIGTLDASNPTRENTMFVVGVEPEKICTMMDGMDEMSPAEFKEMQAAAARLKQKRQGVIIGRNHVENFKSIIGASEKELIGKTIKLTGMGMQVGLNFELEIVGVFPPGRYDNFAVFQRDFYNNQLDSYPNDHRGQAHPLDQGRLSLVWLKVPDTDSYNRVAEQITKSPHFSSPAVKIETASSGIASFLEPLRDLLWGVRFLLVPACVATLSLVIANAISISVRERRQELAVLKVLGFRPWQLLTLVLGEALLLGIVAGVVSAALTFSIINWGFGGIRFPLGFFPCFMIPIDALGWGALLGAGAALAGSLVPAWTASAVKPVDVFSKVA